MLKKLKTKIKQKKEETQKRKELLNSAKLKIERETKIKPLMEKYGLTEEEAREYIRESEKQRTKLERRKFIKQGVIKSMKALHEYGSKKAQELNVNTVSNNTTSNGLGLTYQSRRNPFDFSDIEQMFGFGLARKKAYDFSDLDALSNINSKNPFDFSDIDQMFGFGKYNKHNMSTNSKHSRTKKKTKKRRK